MVNILQIVSRQAGTLLLATGIGNILEVVFVVCATSEY